MQSDKASVEITSRFSGVVKKLHYEAGEMAKVGKPFVDIDIEGGVEPEAVQPEAVETPAAEQPRGEDIATPPVNASMQPPTDAPSLDALSQAPPKPKGKHAGLATPAVRHLLKETKVDIMDVDGTGRDGRVLKEDIHRFVKARDASANGQQASSASTPTPTRPGGARDTSVQTETVVPLSNTELQMFRTMTRSLAIPHFLYADEVDFSSLVDLRRRLNRVLAQKATADGQPTKLSYLPFIIKAVSLALYQFPALNARVDVDPGANKPCLVHRSQHNIGVAMDTPRGLVVPVIRDVGGLNIVTIAAELARLQGLALDGKLSPADLTGGTITVSNVGNIGGTYVSPVIVEREVAILGVGRLRAVPAFDEQDRVVKKQVCNFSWSADHRVVAGATMARAAEVVRKVVEEPDLFMLELV